MVKKITIIACLLITQISFAQNDSLKAEILNYSEANSVIITKGRQLLMDNFLQGDYQKAQNIRNFLIKEVADSRYTPFYLGELWLLDFWTNNYSEILKNVINYDNIIIDLNQKKYPSEDLLYPNLLRESIYSKSKLLDSIEQSSIKKVDKGFLSLFLTYLTAINTTEVTQDSLNQRADNFIALYPNN